jgi:hypothetical protein
MVADDDDLYIERDVSMSEALEIFDLLVGSGPLSGRDVRDAMGLSSRRGPKGGRGSRSTSFSASGKPGKAVHPWFTFSDWQSSDHSDKAAARALSGIVGFDVAKRYAEPGVDPWFWDDEIEGLILHTYGRPPAYPESGPSIGRRPYRGSTNEADAVREALVILDEHPRRVAAAFRAFREARGIRAKAWAGMSAGAKSMVTSLFLDNARIARALLKQGT